MEALEGLLQREDTALVVVDIQEKLFPKVINHQLVLDRCLKTIEFCKRLNIPIIVSEQYPSGLGLTLPAVQDTLGAEYKPIAKTAFSCFGEPAFVEAVEELEVASLVLIGVETHVCVAQTALVGMHGHDLEMVVLADCVSSRDAYNTDVGLRRIDEEGGIISSMEMFFYEMLVRAKTEEHQAVFDLLK